MHNITTPATAETDPLLPADAVPLGFRFAATRAGIKPSGRIDLACAEAAGGTTAAAMFTSNLVVAAPVTVGRRNLVESRGAVRAVIVNSGNANCATGAQGLAAAEATCQAAAALFACPAAEVVPSSTGIIGVPLPVDKLLAALPQLQTSLASGADAFSAFARAILTTDTRPKVAHRAVVIDGKIVRLAGAAKGAGMIHPRLSPPHATMLVYLFTDALADAATLRSMLQGGAEPSFNRISIDGDTSTNDTVLLLASGAAGIPVPAEHAGFRQALDAICHELALAIVEDGEGVTHVVTLEITGAPSDADALVVAKAIAHSPLVKTAWAGNDPNWGRLASTIGASGVAIDPVKLTITLAGLPVCERGERSPRFDETAVHAAMSERRFTIAIDLAVGDGSCRFWTTDLTTEYVHINADYSS
ncbi:bifunctional glutamate N-acetyltransferase/amino-acid acetyltransferase ArgJ [Acidipila sp. EB88]|uniref:bifunctional glutamate N-acetyltransferase/amino-acid acetyltransferase ArgJ n=1 Tax=Acidipila sp. EB88 TaxID=2305226 RepID=UPI000F5F1332|nr:bifunctional glutamate N-acetyltransferase/amino-acid acetyltransferase ArgJ [Acidipila sp. EB88]RRA49710.1 bifunctional glutamate N-acetyltransferase/amino-acid acetyltransferase ArgJ [Acidipila sp. EB88]